ncbi:MAG: dihydroxyacetone kinase phosphoryl donor subunit DhaM [Halanaeroarchaeum sp.]
MIGLLVVSHSEKAAQGIAEVAAQMGSEDARIVPVGGGPDGGIGTAMPAISEALEEMLEEVDGVVVLVDLGSAVMNAKYAIEELGVTDDEVVIADAPILEGALNAATTAASSKATLESVRQAAEEAATVSKV